MENNLATIHNDIIQASYTLSLPEKRLLMSAISKIHPDDIIDTDLEYSKVSIEEYSVCWNMSKSEARREIKAALSTLFERYIVTNEGKTRFRWIGKLTLEDDEALLYWGKDLVPFISQLSKDYTGIKLLYLSGLTSFYHIRLYEWLLSQHNKYRRRRLHTLGLEELKGMLGIEEGGYKDFNRLKERIVVPAVLAINAKTDLKVEWEMKKTGRKVTGLEFTMKKGRRG